MTDVRTGAPLQGNARRRTATPPPKVATGPNTDAARKPASQTDTDKLKKLTEDVLRAGFLRKVYGLLAAQLVLTVLIAAICMYVPPITRTLAAVATAQTWWLRFAFAVPPMLSLFMLQFCKDSYPANYIFLFAFTFFIGIKLGFICAFFSSHGFQHLILLAAAITAVIFVGLTVYTIWSGKDFSYLGGFLYTMLWGLVITGFLAIWFPALREGLLVGFIGAATFCGYILYDTWRLTKKLGYDDYITATIELYLDIVNLFLYILEILVKLNKDNGKKKK